MTVQYDSRQSSETPAQPSDPAQRYSHNQKQNQNQYQNLAIVSANAQIGSRRSGTLGWTIDRNQALDLFIYMETHIKTN